jgi:hypothetical protein
MTSMPTTYESKRETRFASVNVTTFHSSATYTRYISPIHTPSPRAHARRRKKKNNNNKTNASFLCAKEKKRKVK